MVRPLLASALGISVLLYAAECKRSTASDIAMVGGAAVAVAGVIDYERRRDSRDVERELKHLCDGYDAMRRR